MRRDGVYVRSRPSPRTRPPASGPSFLFRSRATWTLLVLLVLLAVMIVWYQRYVAPTLTSRRNELNVEGGVHRDAVVRIDEQRGLVVVTGGERGLRECVVNGSSLLVATRTCWTLVLDGSTRRLAR